MSRPDGRIEKGQRLTKAISARAWNRAQDAADIVLGVRPEAAGGAMAPIEKAANVILVRNNSSYAVPMLGVLRLVSPLVDPSGGTLTGAAAADARAREFVRRPVMRGDEPDNSSDVFGVAMEPIAVSEIGRVAIGGVIPIRIEVADLGHRFAKMREDDVTQLITATCGPMQLVWRQQSVGMNRWGLGVM